MNDLWNEISRRLDLLDISLKEIGSRGQAYAEAESKYRVALAAKILELRADKTPVTITPDIARGTRDIAMLKFDRDCKETLYKAALESINTYKLQIRILENQYEREWGNTRNQ